ncbi:hypothetical protein BBF96_10535 [Anoxybacter fermentans]|uniref:Amphi-Trp domain-containing protein n=1 Tax=Anoxybacter fermentans TaxID=1323375 RepID=A0A3S9SZP1_9FIRM|nr:hypothetical protein [Anoxybacter fermentans]AZR73784.1 hypothetical protein BBF96_10535 [Anoxybacter fermentans]
MKYKHRCSSTKELIQKLEEVVKQIRDHHTILVDWQEVEIPEETVFKVRFKDKGTSRQLKLKIEWECTDLAENNELSGE